ncbi:NAD-dependent histone deacetylase Hst4p [Monosporozyma servazzii]
MTGNSYMLTPPPTLEKVDRKNLSQLSDDVINGKLNKTSNRLVPKSLLPQLVKVEKQKKPKPYYTLKKNKPMKNSVLDIDHIIIDKNKNKENENDFKLKFLTSVLNDCSNIIMITGAGISTHCGIPDFRSTENGLFKSKTQRDNKSLFDINSIYSNNEQTKRFNKLITTLHNLSKENNPTPFHHLIDKLSSQGRLRRIYTQNIDALETKLPSFKLNDPTIFPHLPSTPPYPQLVQLHGSINYTQCNKCYNIKLLNPYDFIDSHDDTDLVPNCSQCQEFEEVRQIAGLRPKGVGKLRPKIVLYNELHPEGDEIANIINLDTKSKKVDCLLIVGTTLEIPGVRQLIMNLNKNLQRQRIMGKCVVIFVSNELPSNKIMKLFDDSGIDLIVHGDCQNLSDLVR